MSQEQSQCPILTQPRDTGVPGRPRSCLVQAVSPTLALLPVPPSWGRGQPQNPPTLAADGSPEGSGELHPSTPWPWGWKEVPTGAQRRLRLTLSLCLPWALGFPTLSWRWSFLPFLPISGRAVITVPLLQNRQIPSSGGSTRP